MLEYGVAAIIIPIKRFYDFLPTRTADSQQERQYVQQHKDDSQTELENKIDRLAEIGLFEQARTGKSIDDLCEELKILKQEFIEMKARMNSIATITLQIKEALLDGRKHYVL